MHPGQIIDKYEVVSYLGGGGMGEVWLAVDRRTNFQVAIKSLHPQLLSNEMLRSRFRNEAVTLSRLRHPNIVGLYNFIEDANGASLIMEYVKGDPLDDYIRLKTGPIPETKAIGLFSQILQGFAYAHQRGVIHRDIKPSNFLIDRYGAVKILDFGIAKVLTDDKGMTKTGTRLGTVFYMSPEQVQGKSAVIASDIYSLGVTLFEMLTGTKPYNDDSTEFQIYNDIVSNPLPRAKTLYPAVSDRMQAVIDKATEKNPSRRFKNCADFLSALTHPEFTYQPKKKAPPPTTRQILPQQEEEGEMRIRPQKSRKRRVRTRVTMTLAVALLIFAAISFSEGWFGLGGSPKEIAKKFLSAVQKGDSDAAQKYGNPECDEQLDMLFELDEETRGTPTFEVLEEEINGSKAKVDYVKYSEGYKYDQVLHLEKHWYGWRVKCSKLDL